MRVLICPDTFKGTASSVEVTTAIRAAVEKQHHQHGHGRVEIDECPLSDGGGGLLAACHAALGADLDIVSTAAAGGVCGPLPDAPRVPANFGVCRRRKCVVMESAAACGLALIPHEKRNPLHTTTFGVGELLMHAARAVHAAATDTSSATHPSTTPPATAPSPTPSTSSDIASSDGWSIILGLGGSGTNDGGCGCLQGAGVAKFFSTSPGTDDADEGSAISAPLCGDDLQSIARCKFDSRRLADVPRIVLWCDVTNPYTGPHGATAVYGPQKGATTPEILDALEKGMVCAAAALEAAAAASEASTRPLAPLASLPGAGAAGGLGGALQVAFNSAGANGCTVESGADAFNELVGLEARVAAADVVISGEGGFDFQTLRYGKTVSRVAALCAQYGKPLVVVCGVADAEARAQPYEALRAVWALRDAFPPEECMGQTTKCITQLVAAKWDEFLVPFLAQQASP
jgi:glycerate kinase